MEIGQAALVADSWGMHGDVGAGWMVAMMVMMVLFWGAVIFGIVWLVHRGSDGWPRGRSDKPDDILKRRFAEGAISEEDYRARRNVLSEQREATGRT